METKKLYYSISEAAAFLDVATNTLRYWETEFSMLSPTKNRGNNRVYTKKDLDIAQKIKYLLYDEGFTIKGALRVMKKLKYIDLASYKKMSALTLNKDFLADFEQLSQILKTTFPVQN